MKKNKKTKILHIITRMIVGGAQENTLISIHGLNMISDYEAELLTGPAIGPEGDLIKTSPKDISVNYCNFLRRNINPFYDLAAFIQIYSFIKKGNFDIVHTHSSKAGIIGRMAAKFANVPVIVHTVHGLPFFAQQNKLLNILYSSLERYVSKFTDKIICVSPSLIDEAVKANVAQADKFETVYSGINLEQFKNDPQIRFSFRKRLHLDDQTLVIGKLARLSDLKGHDFLLDAAVLVKKQITNFKILLIGDGKLRKKIEVQAKKLGIENNLVFTGLIEPQQVPYFLQCVDVLAHTSLHEGLPRAVVQGFALKIPAVCFDIDGAKDIIRHGQNGYLVPAKEIKQLAEFLIKLLKNRDLAQTMGENGYHYVQENFNTATMISSIDFIYRRLLKQCGK